jgi:hypothetical protein
MPGHVAPDSELWDGCQGTGRVPRSGVLVYLLPLSAGVGVDCAHRHSSGVWVHPCHTAGQSLVVESLPYCRLQFSVQLGGFRHI